MKKLLALLALVPSLAWAQPYSWNVGSGLGSVPTASTQCLWAVSTANAASVCLALGTGLSITSGTLNSSGGGGSGTVNSGTAGQLGYYAATGTTISGLTLSPSFVITTGVLLPAQLQDVQTGTSYTICFTAPCSSGNFLPSGATNPTDAGALVSTNNGSAIAVTIPAASSWPGASFDTQNKGAGTATYSCSGGCTINGSATLAEVTSSGCTFSSDGTNWQVSLCSALVSAGGSGSFSTLSSTGIANLANGLTQAANTSADGLTLIDSTTASATNQQFSPRLRLSGQGWKTTATAASEQVDWIMETQPVQGTTTPTSNLVWSEQINGTGYTAELTLNSAGNLTLGGAGKIVAGNLQVTATAVPANGVNLPAANTLGLSANSTQIVTATNVTITALEPVALPNYIVSGLPTCSSAVNKYASAVVTDASSPTYLGTLTGSSTTVVRVLCNGTAWVAD